MKKTNELGMMTFAKSGSKRMTRFFNLDNLEKHSMKKDIDQKGNTFFPYWDEDTSLLFLPGKGSGQLMWVELRGDASTKKRWYPSSLTYNNADSAVGGAFLPKRFCDVNNHTIATYYMLTQKAIVPIFVSVPRKQSSYQSDIYADAYAGVPAISADEWQAGKDGEPVKMSMDPSKRGEQQQQKMTFVKKKTYQELEAENAALKARVAELEAKLGGADEEEKGTEAPQDD